MALDALLAFLHFVLAFLIFGALASEAVLLRQPLTARGLKLLSSLDSGYGVSAGLLIFVGVLRVFFGVRGPDYYNAEPFFWAKMVAFALVGLLSIMPTIAFIKWRRAVKADANFLPDAAAVKRVQRWIALELIIFWFIPLFAVLMARGFGAH